MSTRAKELTGRHVALITASAFALVLAVNVVFITVAVRSFRGEDVPDAYSRGLAYNEALEQRAAQEALGWTAALGTETLPTGALQIELTLKDADGQPVAGAEAEILFRRPTHDGEDATLTLNEIAPGIHHGEVALAGAGVWDARGEVTRSKGERFFFEERLWVE